MSLSPNCLKCGAPFDDFNTGWKVNSHYKDGTPRSHRYCKACNRRATLAYVEAHRGPGPRRGPGRPRKYPPAEPQPLPVFFTHTRRVETCDCEPWAGQACEDCAALWAFCVAESEMQEWAVAS